MGNAYIYALLCPTTGCVRYVGKANDPKKRLLSHCRDSRRRRTPVLDWIRGLGRRGEVPRLEVLACAITSNWQSLERQIIDQYRKDGCPLLNVADGGDEPHCPLEVRRANGRRLCALLKANGETDGAFAAVRALLAHFGRQRAYFSGGGHGGSRFIQANPQLAQRMGDVQQRIRELVAREGHAVTAYIFRDMIARVTDYRMVDENMNVVSE